ncbi:Hypothetical predicted protein [Paramuricea clavata]|uniref:Uncharacterized protein n=1 Tax=Paramuricea clavata TaxID=317549 RepID=A0A7D9LF65_PARCT|nr:Hypothetical predicted protein [Paramuricea clavata]
MQLNKAYVEGHQLTIMGDFNIDVSKNTSDSQCWLESMGDLHLHQIVTESTRVTENTSTLLDHVFTSVPHKIRSVKVPRIGISDHYPTCVVFKDSFGRKHSHTTIKDAKTTYYKTCVEDHKGDSKKLWQYLRDIIPTNLKTAPSSLRNNSNNSSISDPEDMCEHFNNFFSTIVNQYVAVQQFSSNFDKLSEMVNSRINSDDAFSIPQLTEEEVCSYLRNLDTHKATGLDGLIKSQDFEDVNLFNSSISD